MMLQITPQHRILLAVEPIDFRKGMGSLAALVESPPAPKAEPQSAPAEPAATAAPAAAPAEPAKTEKPEQKSAGRSALSR